MRPWTGTLIVRDAPVDLDAFTATELAIADAFKLPSRRDEWLLSRLAAKRLALDLGIADELRSVTVERPYVLVNGERTDWRVSLSHSSPYAGAMIARAPVGIDVQHVRELDERAAHLFLTDSEIEQLHACTLAHRILHFWCAKEAAWKRRSEEFVTLRQVPLQLLEERAESLRFAGVETIAIDDFVAAVTLPTS